MVLLLLVQIVVVHGNFIGNLGISSGKFYGKQKYLLTQHGLEVQDVDSLLTTNDNAN